MNKHSFIKTVTRYSFDKYMNSSNCVSIYRFPTTGPHERDYIHKKIVVCISITKRGRLNLSDSLLLKMILKKDYLTTIFMVWSPLRAM